MGFEENDYGKYTLKQPEEMSQFFNVRSSGYDDHMKECIESFDEFYRRLSESINSTEEQIRILDLGCGTGAEIKEILNKAPEAQIIAIDASEKMLLELKKKHDEIEEVSIWMFHILLKELMNFLM